MTLTRTLQKIALQQRHTYPVAPPQKAHQLAGLSRIDYTDAFRANTTIDRSAREWAQVVFEGPQPPLPALLHALWSKCVRLDLGPRADRRRILGWKVTAPCVDEVILASDAPGMQVRLVALVEPGTLSWTTTIHYKKAYGRVIFTLLGSFHRAMAKYLLARATAP